MRVAPLGQGGGRASDAGARSVPQVVVAGVGVVVVPARCREDRMTSTYPRVRESSIKLKQRVGPVTDPRSRNRIYMTAELMRLTRPLTDRQRERVK